MFCPPLNAYQFKPPSSETNIKMSFFPFEFVNVGGVPAGQSNVKGHVIETEVAVYVNISVKFVTIPLAGILLIDILVIVSVRDTANILATFKSRAKVPLEEDAVALSSSEYVATPAAVIIGIE